MARRPEHSRYCSDPGCEGECVCPCRCHFGTDHCVICVNDYADLCAREDPVYG